MDAGKRDQLITFERATAASVNDYGEVVPGAPEDLVTAWAQVRWGSGQERREAAQESGSQAATFVCDRNPTLDGVLITDRILFQGVYWDITSIAPVSRSDIHFTATRSV